MRSGFSSETTRAIVRGAAAAALNRLWTPLLSLAVTPFLLARLGAESYGLFALALSAAAWLGLADLGLAPALRVRLARGDEPLEEQRRLFGTALRVQAATAGVVVACGFGLAAGVPVWLDLEPSLRATAAELLLWLAVGAAISLAVGPFSAALEALGFVALEQSARTVKTLVRTLAAVALVAAGYDVRALGYAHVVAAGSGAVWIVWLWRRRLPELQPKFYDAPWRTLRTVFAGGAWLTAGAFAGTLIGGLDRVVIASFLSLEETARFALTGVLFVLLEEVVTRAADAARPFLAARLGTGDTASASRLKERLTESCLLAGLVSAAVAFAANPAFVAAWTGPASYAGGAVDAFLAANLVLHLWVLPQRAALTAGWRLRGQVYVRLVEGLFNLLLSVIFVRWWGLAGVAAGTTVAALAASAWILPRMASQALGAPRNAHSFRRTAWLAAALAPAAWIARDAGLEASGWLGAGLAAAIVAATALIALALLFRRPIERRLGWLPAGAAGGVG